MPDLLVVSPAGLRCPVGDFHLDPWAPVDVAVITHGHADHARPGAQKYICTPETARILARRLVVDGKPPPIEPHACGEPFRLGDAVVSFHPAGHILGSAQVRIVVDGETWVHTGDYKRAPDPTCAPFEVVPCDVLVTEATFALPIFRWSPTAKVIDEIAAWWDACRAANQPAILFCYALGKAQRILAELAQRRETADREVLVHGAIEGLVRLYRDAGVRMLPTRQLSDKMRGAAVAGELVLAPAAAMATPWMRRFPDGETAFASGWMRIRGKKTQRAVDRGFVLSDHADWPALVETIAQTGARRVLVTHGQKEALARFLVEKGVDARPLATAFEGEADAP